MDIKQLDERLKVCLTEFYKVENEIRLQDKKQEIIKEIRKITDLKKELIKKDKVNNNNFFQTIPNSATLYFYQNGQRLEIEQKHIKNWWLNKEGNISLLYQTKTNYDAKNSQFELISIDGDNYLTLFNYEGDKLLVNKDDIASPRGDNQQMQKPKRNKYYKDFDVYELMKDDIPTIY